MKADKSKCSKSSQDAGVKGLFILCIVPDMQELFENIQNCVQELSLTCRSTSDGFSYVLATDLKLGFQSHNSTHACCYCEASETHWNLQWWKLWQISPWRGLGREWLQLGWSQKIQKLCPPTSPATTSRIRSYCWLDSSPWASSLLRNFQPPLPWDEENLAKCWTVASKTWNQCQVTMAANSPMLTA